MPFDSYSPLDPGRSVILDAYRAETERLKERQPKPDRWNSHLDDTPTLYRNLLPLSDTTILRAMRDILRKTPDKWIRGNVGHEEAACAVGWVMHFTEPHNRPKTVSPQRRSVMARLYWALPKSARRSNGKDVFADVAAYNDKNSNATLDRWLTRAIANEPR